MLAQHALLIAISSDLNAYGVVCEFDWNDGNGQEGWPPMDGSEGIRITDIDTSGIFDSDDMTIKAALSAALPHTNNASLEAFFRYV